MKFNEQYIDIENGGAPNSIFSQNALASLKSQLLLVLILLVVVIFRSFKIIRTHFPIQISLP